MVSYRDLVLRAARTRLGTSARQALGGVRVRMISDRVLGAEGGPVRTPRVLLASAQARRTTRPDEVLPIERGAWVHPLANRRPAQLRDEHLALVAGLLERADVRFVLIRPAAGQPHAVAVEEADRARVLGALAHDPQLRTASVHHVVETTPLGPALLAPAVLASKVMREAGVLRVFTVARSESGTLTVGAAYGCDLEFWVRDLAPDLGQGVLRAPRTNAASAVLPAAEMAATEPVVVAGRTYPRPRVFGARMLEDVTFDIDAVYTWVDGADPVWRERMLRARAQERGQEYHAESLGANRFTDRDELRYSLRSLQMYAPWVRQVYLVTDHQVPRWLRAEHPGLTVIDHHDIFDDHRVLPVFNSNAIISRLHHIDGLSEHYLYLNDDMFFGRDTQPNQFFFPSGVARLFPARLDRPFGPPTAADGPHLNLSRNIRALIEREFGITLTRAIRHTPYTQLRSKQFELEALFAEEYRRSTHSRFRHHDDIVADQLLHYYLQVTGDGVPSGIGYDYVNVGLAEQQPRLSRLLRERSRSVFCLNDAPEPGSPAMTAAAVVAFLEAYFPVPSDFEGVDQGV